MGIPNVNKSDVADAGTFSRGGFLQSGIYKVVAGDDFVKNKINSKTGEPLPKVKNGQWLLPINFPGGQTDYIFVNHFLNDDGTDREDKDADTIEKYRKSINTLLDCAGVDSLDDLPGAEFYVQYRACTKAAREAKRWPQVEAMDPGLAEARLNSGYVVPDVDVPAPRAAQADRTAAPARTATTTPPRRPNRATA